MQADAILNMRLRNLRKLEEMEIKREDKELREERKALKKLLRSEKEQWKTVAGEIKKVRETFGPKTPLGKRRTDFAEAPEHDEAAIEEAMVEREPITVVVSEKGWIRALRGHVDRSVRRRVQGRRRARNSRSRPRPPSKLLVFATNGRFYTLDAAKLPGGRGHGEPVRLYRRPRAGRATSWRCSATRAAASSWSASAQGRGFVVAEDECLANTRKGKQVLNVKPPDDARAVTRRSRASWSRRSARTARW